MIKEAMLYRPVGDQKVRCYLCHHHCQIANSKFGFCGVRENREGTLYSHVYGEAIAANIDPIEKKPLYHFLPGTTSFSIATVGCNFRCGFCQNWQISQVSKKKGTNVAGYQLLPEEVVRRAKESGCKSISYTYTEPTIFFEYAYDTAKLAKEEGLFNVFVTNGYMTPEALETINPYLDACNVDLKSFKEEFYKEICHGHLEPVLDSIRLMKKLHMWVEITTLVVPGQNDDEEELTEIAHFIAEVDSNIPWHISRFHPDYQFTDSRPTPLDVLQRAYSIGEREGLRHIYIGNVIGVSEDTVCAHCQKSLIRRKGYVVEENRVKDSRCPYCGDPVAGVFKA
ncbi:MAG: AmmeMemoRadiSam system radical SAM enzyme [Deltaproteobacteria bacterium]|nr:MAG: AmmeMemoRadiSam system radical SAM enzyme [Deltaproteobacteria bacterium]